MLLAIVIGALAFLAIGFAISGIAPNTETAASYANLITFPMMFLSGVIWLAGMKDLGPDTMRVEKIAPLEIVA